MATWKIAGVQMDCRLGDPEHNRSVMNARLQTAAAQGATFVAFPECALSGYCYESREEAWPFAEPIPGPTTLALAEDCRRLGVWCAFGLLERGAAGQLFNTCALVGPDGLAATYRKAHLPFLGVDRFTTPGDRPFAVHDLGGLRVGMLICYDGGFPEAARVLMLQGADLIVLITNWPTGAVSSAKYLVPARALENHVYFLAVNRVGEERGFHFIGQSRLVDCTGETLSGAAEGESVFVGEVDPDWARRKRLVKVPGKYELDRIGDRRPELYGPLGEPRVQKQ